MEWIPPATHPLSFFNDTLWRYYELFFFYIKVFHRFVFKIFCKEKKRKKVLFFYSLVENLYCKGWFSRRVFHRVEKKRKKKERKHYRTFENYIFSLSFPQGCGKLFYWFNYTASYFLKSYPHYPQYYYYKYYIKKEKKKKTKIILFCVLLGKTQKIRY